MEFYVVYEMGKYCVYNRYTDKCFGEFYNKEQAEKLCDELNLKSIQRILYLYENK